MDDEIDYFLATLGLSRDDVLLIPFGSRVYGTHNDGSDHDSLAVVPRQYRLLSGTEYRRNELNVQVYNSHAFQKHLDQHQVHAVEAYFVPGSGCAGRFRFRLEKKKLRAEWLRKSSHSFVRARKKIHLESDLTLGKKSLFHSLRILRFGADRDGRPHRGLRRGERVVAAHPRL